MDDTHDTDGSGRGEKFADVLTRRLARRSFLKGALVGGATLAIGPAWFQPRGSTAARHGDSLTFTPISASRADKVVVPPGYTAQVVLRWGDPLSPGLPPFHLQQQSAERQARQFGYNCDFVSYFPLPRYHPHDAKSGILAVNHEFTKPELMFTDYTPGNPTRQQVDIAMAAHGVSIVAIGCIAKKHWQSQLSSSFNRRITAETEMEITGPAAGHKWMRTSADRSGTRVRGTLNNCAGGKTPWGTLLTCEENFHYYFANCRSLADTDPRKAIHRRYGLLDGASVHGWERFHQRFDLAKDANEPFRFGWVVEIDPYNPLSTPKKRTALGRTKHEAATVAIATDGRAIVYSGDDERFEYIYKFISRGRFDAARHEANAELLDSGTLYVAAFRDDGTGKWLPLVGGQGALQSWPHAEVLLNTRGAADVVGATKMDRPEDIETSPVNGKVYCVMTNNSQRGAGAQVAATNGANPRKYNRHGHILELTEADNDATATQFEWSIFMLCGDPRVTGDGAFFAGFDPAQVCAISSPDNIAFDRQGNLWIATDGQAETLQQNDGVYVVPVAGETRGHVRHFLSAPVGAEVCGPEFTPDMETFFCSIQHPGNGSSLAHLRSTWPDGTVPPRPSIIAVVKTDGDCRIIGS